MNDLVSIVTPCYHCAPFIARTIESVLAQTYPHWEMIIVDDGSTDSSADVILSYAAGDDRIKLIQLAKNTGAGAARNTAIKAAGGRYIAFLDGDDLWLPGKLEKQLGFMGANDLAFTYASYQLIDENGDSLGRFIAGETITYERLLKTCEIGCLTAIYDTRKLNKVYMPDAPRREDYALWLQIVKKIRVARGMAQPLASYRVGKQSLSSNKLRAAFGQWKVYRKNENLGVLKSGWYFLHYAFHGARKHVLNSRG